MVELRRMRPLLGTYVEVGACAPDAEAALAAAFASLKESHARWSFHEPMSELSRLNCAPGQAVRLSPPTLRLLRIAKAMMRASGSRFDCTVGGALVRQGLLPDHGPGLPLRCGKPEDIELGRGWARLLRPVRLTLDGIAKGFAVDLALQALRRAGAVSGWVNAGGDLRVFGDRAVPVQRREADGALRPLGMLRDAAMASSRAGGEADDAFPSHIVGAVAADAAEVVTVIARSAWRADALTKVAAAVPVAERERAVAHLGGCLVDARAWKQAA
jgi:thiamine biosynthesis lipoprotein